MPISKENAERYPENWPVLRTAVLERAGNCCEGSPAYPDCRAPNGAYRIKDGPNGGWVTMNQDEAFALAERDADVSRIVLTIAHLEHDDLETQDISRLRAWCQRCHLTYDAKHHAETARATRRGRKAIGELF